MTIQIRSIFNDLGVRSVRELFRKTGSPERSLRRQAQIASIGSYYLRHGGFRGPFGFPISEVDFSVPHPSRKFAGGLIEFKNTGPRGEIKTQVSITFLGFHCNAESDWDQSSDSDEPYFLIGAIWPGGNTTVRFGPYEDVDNGEDRFELGVVMTMGGPPPVGLIVVGNEHDWGTPEEAEAKLRAAVKDVEAKVDAAAQSFGAFTGSSEEADSHVMPQWARDIYLGWFVEWGAALLGLGDDHIGKATKLLLDYDKTLTEWVRPPDIEKFGENFYNLMLRVSGNDEGDYNLFFKVDVFHVTIDLG